METELTVYVPAPDSPLRHQIARGSAIVGRPAEGSPVVLIYYEGNVYGQFPSYHEKLAAAAGRLVERYPTVARCLADLSDLTPVGSYWIGGAKPALSIDDEAALAQWLDTTGAD
jgi:hypothetical protein